MQVLHHKPRRTYCKPDLSHQYYAELLEYVLYFGCGIPDITLLGTVDDWKDIRRRAEILMKYDLDWWSLELLPLLDEFVLAAEGRPNMDFWKSICNFFEGSGYRTPITGWIQALFPYLRYGKRRGGRSCFGGQQEEEPLDKSLPTLVKNQYMGEWRKSVENQAIEDLSKGMNMRRYNRCGSGVKLESIPSGICMAPFTLVDLRTEESYDMKFCGGLTCSTQNQETGALRARVGWATVETPEK